MSLPQKMHLGVGIAKSDAPAFRSADFSPQKGAIVRPYGLKPALQSI
jgi:hypothetical protein